MRLEINAGGLDSFYNGVSSFVSSGASAAGSNNLINSLQAVADKTNSISGGVGTLGTALGYIQTRKAAEESRKIAVQAVKNQTGSFIQAAIRADNAVAVTASLIVAGVVKGGRTGRSYMVKYREKIVRH
jgi:hypothetical protein